jgi:inhibitor of growth protein 3
MPSSAVCPLLIDCHLYTQNSPSSHLFLPVPSGTGSILQITAKLTKLLGLIEDPDATPADRLALLCEVAEDARSFKLGGEDKIRVATGTCETVSRFNPSLSLPSPSSFCLFALKLFVGETLNDGRFWACAQISHHTTQLDLLASHMTSLLPPHALESLPSSAAPSGYPLLNPPPQNPAARTAALHGYFAPPASAAYAQALHTVQDYQRDGIGMAGPGGPAAVHSPLYMDPPIVSAPPPKSRAPRQPFQNSGGGGGGGRRARASDEPLRVHHNQHTKKREHGGGIASASASVGTVAPNSDRAEAVGSPAASAASGQERGGGGGGAGRRAAASPSLERAAAGGSNGNGSGSNNGVGKRRVFNKRSVGTKSARGVAFFC